MSSILTNNGAMTALQSLKSTNKNLGVIQSQISTGKAIGSAKDNSAMWAISKVMESDVKGFKAISESLSLGQSTVSVARQASETVTDLLTQMKSKIVASQGQNVDRVKLDADVQALKGQISSVVGAAQFNGLNLVNGTQTALNAAGGTGINVLSSLDRDSAGNIAVSNIGVNAQNLSTTTGTALTAATAPTVTSLAANGGTDATVIAIGSVFATAAGAQTGAVALKADAAGVVADPAGFIEGDNIRLQVGDKEGSYTIRAGDTASAVLAGLKNGLVAAGLSETDFSFDLTTAGSLTIENQTNKADIAVSLTQTRGSGGLAALGASGTGLNVLNKTASDTALATIDTMIDTAINAAASFGSVQSRLETQSDFVSSLSDSLKSGIGALVDADMEEASARLQALQVQQQLGVQALSIANQAPQSVLSLFR